MIGLFEVSLPSGDFEEDLRLFRYAFSHDLKASLRPVLGFGHYLKEGEVLSARTGEFQSKMIQAGRILDRQLDGLADYAGLCLRAPRLELLDLANILQGVVEEQLASFRLGEECVELAGTIPPVVADRPIVKLIFSEIVGNALCFTQADRVPRVKISCRREGDLVETLIQDSGLGIPGDCLTLLGKPFQRFHAEKHLVPGTGLGLSRAVRGLAALQGRLQCHSSAGQGSLFLVGLQAG